MGDGAKRFSIDANTTDDFVLSNGSPTASITASKMQLLGDQQSAFLGALSQAGSSRDISPFDVEDDEAAVLRDPSRVAKMNRYVFSLVGAYIVVGTTIVLFNKWMLNVLEFRFPITMILTHLTCTGSIAMILVMTVFKSKLQSEEYWPFNISRSAFFTQIVPPGILLGMDIVCTSAAIEFSSVSLVEVIKSGIPMLVLVAGFVLRQEVFSIFKVLIISVLCIGIFCTSYGEINLDPRGLSLATLATVSGASRLLLMQVLLSNPSPKSPSSSSGSHAKLNPMLSLAYFAPVSAVFLFFPWLFIEASSLFQSEFVNKKIWILLILLMGVCLAFLINYLELLLVEASNALTLCVSGIMKLIVLIFVSAAIFGYQFTAWNVTGILLAITGVVGYNYLRFYDEYLTTSASFERVANETEDAFVSDY
eukprot:TRINITY_DN21583_c0_g1_i3.p1 TRINITY_DN21583_c0_g1~~TRINITY_DN21583_c0_g1_i3.p1  ORF type:complete len:421 (-),score=102.70 TRINITY_DN21583_c0_g1_i3:839-2101(-)